jgi:hypothetical protein
VKRADYISLLDVIKVAHNTLP